ncbi:MAG: rRNA pseudouridine synthase [Clostridiaceae bacterium]|nr:rRNA pseudouridine synthase [Clostridiaceae bacterium]
MKRTQRLDKVLSNFGFGSRSEIKKLVKAGRVVVDGMAAKDASVYVDPENSNITVNGKKLNYRKFIYVMMNKPAGIISATYDAKLKTAIDILPEEFACFDLFPAGRLDIDTEGMLLLTNDGQLAHDILSPKKHVDKRYYALIDGQVTDEDVQRFADGVVIDDGYRTMPAELSVIRSGLRSEIELVLHEGKFHQVKRMFEAVGKKVVYLKRIQMGGLRLDESLEPGECRELTAEEVELLKR